MPEDLSQWVPERVRWGGASPVVEWIHCGGRRFTEPFFEDTVRRFRREPSTAEARRQTGMEEVEAWADARPGLPPSGFVFHLSRSGSTLISQMLAALERNRVMSEATPLDDVLRLEFRRPELDGERLAGWLRAMVSALGQPAAAERHYFVKWDCWHIHQAALIRRAFPQTPWIFLYRDPLEVLVSQMRNPGAWTVPGALEAALTGGADARQRREEYCAQLLAGICRAAIEQRAVLVNYTELPEAVCGRLAAFFGVEYPAAERQQMLAAAQFDAKSPQFHFAGDGEAKRRAASPHAVEAAEHWTAGVYRELERLRQAGQGLEANLPLSRAGTESSDVTRL
jgi:hypothetical protein